jgi:hypothetical protein
MSDQESYLSARAKAIQWIEQHPEAVPALMAFEAEERRIHANFEKMLKKVLWQRLGERPPFPQNKSKHYEEKAARVHAWTEKKNAFIKRTMKAAERAVEQMSAGFRRAHGLSLEVFKHTRGIAQGLVEYEYGSEASRLDAVVLNWAGKVLKDRTHAVLTGSTKAGVEVVIAVMDPGYARRRGFLK